MQTRDNGGEPAPGAGDLLRAQDRLHAQLFAQLLESRPEEIADAMATIYRRAPREVEQLFDGLEVWIRDALVEFFLLRTYQAVCRMFAELVRELDLLND